MSKKNQFVKIESFNNQKKGKMGHNMHTNAYNRICFVIFSQHCDWWKNGSTNSIHFSSNNYNFIIFLQVNRICLKIKHSSLPRLSNRQIFLEKRFEMSVQSNIASRLCAFSQGFQRDRSSVTHLGNP